MKLELETGKTVEITNPEIRGWTGISVRIRFVELDITRNMVFDIERIKRWLKENPEKDWKDYLKEFLLPFYDGLAETKKIKDAMVAT